MVLVNYLCNKRIQLGHTHTAHCATLLLRVQSCRSAATYPRRRHKFCEKLGYGVVTSCHQNQKRLLHPALHSRPILPTQPFFLLPPQKTGKPFGQISCSPWYSCKGKLWTRNYCVVSAFGKSSTVQKLYIPLCAHDQTKTRGHKGGHEWLVRRGGPKLGQAAKRDTAWSWPLLHCLRIDAWFP